MAQPRIVTWRAVSTEDQADRESLAHQSKLNREHVARWDGVVVAELEVPGMSRNYILWSEVCQELDAFAQLDDLIKRKAFDVLMCMDMTRLGRTAALVATLAALCEKAGIRIYETSSPPSDIEAPSSFDSRLLMLFKAGQSEHEVRKFIERSLFGRQAQVRKGKNISTPPTGYKKIYDTDGNPVMVIDEERAPIVKIFYELYLDHGLSLRTIAREFNARGYPRPVGGAPTWNQSGTGRFLVNRWTYAGYATWGQYSKNPEKSFRVRGEWPALITEEMVYHAEEEMKKRSHGPRAAGSPSLFSLSLRCGVCKGSVTVKSIGGRHSKYTCYICQNECKGSFIRDPVIIAAVREAILLLQNDLVLEQMVGELPNDNTTLPAQIEATKAILEQTQQERTKLTRAYMRDTLRIEEYDSLMAELKEQQTKLAHTITALEDELAQMPSPVQRRNRLEDIRDNGLAMLDHPNRPTANAWIRRHFAVVVKNNTVEKIFLY